MHTHLHPLRTAISTPPKPVVNGAINLEYNSLS